MTIHFERPGLTLYHGDALEVLSTMADQSVDCVVTSPAYFGLRDYGVAGQMGTESSPKEYVERLRDVFTQVRRVLAPDGTCWLVLGDSYNSGAGNQNSPNAHRDGTRDTKQMTAEKAGPRPKSDSNLPTKNLLGMPWRVALALQATGWIIRNDIIWSKTNAMPQSVTDRLSPKHEHVFLLVKSQRYFFNLDGIRQPLIYPDAADGTRTFGGKHKSSSLLTGSASRLTGQQYINTHPGGKNPGDVWMFSTVPFPGAHFAAFPPKLVNRCLTAGCRPGGTVLDPFSGSGTTGMVAAQMGLDYIGIDLSVEYLDLSLSTRLRVIR